ncbi:hypothetical protein Dda_0752 [Drechslerella dactyloides]|uniref:Uncharacterized protein n=1 Tax=Drechslerella dactyloides TaxID=74499 RepID=A0AAD6J500_DREDA|nr:hypothetical protein Dda_0752 [Drechslerella dactyloides]
MRTRLTTATTYTYFPTPELSHAHHSTLQPHPPFICFTAPQTSPSKMPPKAPKLAPATEFNITLHLKSSTATLFLILPASATFETLQSNLHDLLTEAGSHLPPSLHNPPSSPSALRLGVPKDLEKPRESTFIPLDDAAYKNGKGTLHEAGLAKDSLILAFKIVEDDSAWDGEFDVVWPRDDYTDSQDK